MPSQFVRRARELPLATVLVAALAVGCTESNEPSSNQATLAPSTTLTEAELKAATGRGADAEFTRLSRQIPGFGGMFYDKAGKLNVYMKAPSGVTTMRSADVAARLRAVGNASVQARLNKSSDLVTLAAKYDYAELQAYRGRLSKIFGVKGVVFTDTDEEANRVKIAIEPGADEARVFDALAKAGVPREVVTIKRMSAIKDLKSIQTKFRPTTGGIQLAFLAQEPGFFFICTIGFNVRISGKPGHFFTTNSHCSDEAGGNQHTEYFQSFPRNSDRIGEEAKDPRFGNPGALCIYVGFRCRLADILLAKYNGGNLDEHGTIARTTFVGQRIGSLRVDNDHPRFFIVTEFGFPFLGEIVHKVGRTTGWTAGPVIETCVDVGSSGTDRVLLCQDIALAGSGGGDSGSPVFEQVGADEVALTGILWGGGTSGGAPVFVLSPMENIELDLGPLETEVF